MNLNMNVNLQQEQKLILTAQMQTSLKLLQMPVVELQENIEKELYENPLLEVDYNNSEEDESINQDTFYREQEVSEFNNLIRNSSYDSYMEESYQNDDEEYNNPFHYISKTTSLKDYLLEQMNDRDDRYEMKELSKYLIECIDDDGFIAEDILVEIKNKTNAPDLVEEALKIVQELQPWGIGAKDFKESLLIQIRKRGLHKDKLADIIMNYLELVAGGKWKEISKIIGVNIDTLKEYISIIKSLEPKPARGFYTGETIKYIVPEAYIKKVGSDYYIIMNDDMLPKLNVNNYYRTVLLENNNQEAVDFIKDKVSSALSLIKGIDQRQNTIYRILEKIVEFQRDYLDRGELYLKPMSLKDISSALNLHESTVSRAIKDKYVGTPRGNIKMKELFTNGINIVGNEEDMSSRIIKKSIETIVSEEDKHKPLSDQAISEILMKDRISISRRTVSKYREEMGIKSSSKRKNLF